MQSGRSVWTPNIVLHVLKTSIKRLLPIEPVLERRLCFCELDLPVIKLFLIEPLSTTVTCHGCLLQNILTLVDQNRVSHAIFCTLVEYDTGQLIWIVMYFIHYGMSTVTFGRQNDVI